MNEPSWHLLGLIQSASLLGAERTGISLMELLHLPAPFLSGLLSIPNRLRRLSFPTHSVAGFPVVRFSSHLWYYTAVRQLTKHHSPLRSRL
jgi:hypothetical protein